jgi:hypothetical protein
LQIRDNSQLGSPDHTYRLLIRNTKPDFRLGIAADSVAGPLGGVAKIPITISADEGFNSMIEVTAVGLPAGLTAKPLTLGFGQDSGALEIAHDSTALPPDEKGWIRVPVKVVATAEAGKEKISREAELPPFYGERGAGYNERFSKEFFVAFVEPARFSMNLDEPFRGFRLDLSKDRRVEIAIQVKRAGGFQAPLTFEGVNLPEGVRVEAGAEAEGVVKVALIADPEKAQPVKLRIALRATAEEAGRRFSEVTRGFGLQMQ